MSFHSYLQLEQAAFPFYYKHPPKYFFPYSLVWQSTVNFFKLVAENLTIAWNKSD